MYIREAYMRPTTHRGWCAELRFERANGLVGKTALTAKIGDGQAGTYSGKNER